MTPPPNPQRAVFLDRDGTINVDPGYLRLADQMALLPDVGPALAKLQTAGFLLVVVSNQSGVGRGLIEPQELPRIHDRLNSLLKKHGAKIDAFYFCIHPPEDGCDCRKPKPALILNAAKDHQIDLARSWMVGDKLTDIQAGIAAGLQGSILVLTGEGEASRARVPHGTPVVKDLSAAVAAILSS